MSEDSISNCMARVDVDFVQLYKYFSYSCGTILVGFVYPFYVFV